MRRETNAYHLTVVCCCRLNVCSVERPCLTRMHVGNIDGRGDRCGQLSTSVCGLSTFEVGVQMLENVGEPTDRLGFWTFVHLPITLGSFEPEVIETQVVGNTNGSVCLSVAAVD